MWWNEIVNLTQTLQIRVSNIKVHASVWIRLCDLSYVLLQFLYHNYLVSYNGHLSIYTVIEQCISTADKIIVKTAIHYWKLLQKYVWIYLHRHHLITGYILLKNYKTNNELWEYSCKLFVWCIFNLVKWGGCIVRKDKKPSSIYRGNNERKNYRK